MAETVSQAVVFLNHFRDLPDPRQAGKALYPLEGGDAVESLAGVRRSPKYRRSRAQSATKMSRRFVPKTPAIG
jgi:hypothetical protein